MILHYGGISLIGKTTKREILGNKKTNSHQSWLFLHVETLYFKGLI